MWLIYQGAGCHANDVSQLCIWWSQWSLGFKSLRSTVILPGGSKQICIRGSYNYCSFMLSNSCSWITIIIEFMPDKNNSNWLFHNKCIRKYTIKLTVFYNKNIRVHVFILSTYIERMFEMNHVFVILWGRVIWV